MKLRKLFILILRKLQSLPFVHHHPPLFLPYRKAVLLSMKRPVNLKSIEHSILTYTNDDIYTTMNRLEQSINYLRNKRRFKRDASNFSVAAVRAICHKKPEIGVEFGKKIFLNHPDERGYRTIVSHLWRLHRADEAIDFLKLMSSSDWKREQMEKLVTWMSRKSKSDDSQQVKPIIESIKPKNIDKTRRQIKKRISSISDMQNMTIACILDEFSYNSFKHEANFVQLSVTDYQLELKHLKPDLLFVESAWRGKDNLWGSKVGHASTELLQILEFCEHNHIPTVFWNKEDPVHFNSFLNVAKLFDYIFTTDIDCIHRYKSSLNHNDVFLLPFAFQPKITNPIKKYERKSGVCFAGAYYRKYPERTRDLGNLIRAVKNVTDLTIYDRNYGLKDENYYFPEEFQNYIVGTLPFEKIDLAYKGFEFGLNLNSIKQSQSMFARRVFELVASNTIVISNYSRGTRNFFGDIILMSDNENEIEVKLRDLIDDEAKMKKIKLLGLRNVVTNHTYQQRLAYVLSKVSKDCDIELLPPVSIVSRVENVEQVTNLIKNYNRQSYNHKSIFIITESDFDFSNVNLPEGATILNSIQFNGEDNFADNNSYSTVFASSDYYGPNYILDLVLATKYSDYQVITKGVYYKKIGDNFSLVKSENSPYSECLYFDISKSLISNKLLKQYNYPDIFNLSRDLVDNIIAFAIDEFNYCEGAISDKNEELSIVDDINDINTGMPFDEMIKLSENIIAEQNNLEGDYISSVKIFQDLSPISPNTVELIFDEGNLKIKSSLSNEKHTYLYWPNTFKPSELNFKDGIGKFYFDTKPGLRLMLAIVMLNEYGEKIDSKLALSNSNMIVELHEKCKLIKLGIRVYSSGEAEINTIDLFHHDLSPKKVIGQSEYLVLTNHYPAYDNIYRNAFIHSRVKNYQKKGLKPDIFKLRSGEKINYSEFEGVDIISGSKEALDRLLKSCNYKSILIHFFDKEMWNVIKHYKTDKDILIWVHGSEIQPWHRRTFNYSNDKEINKAKIDSQKRMKFWRPFLRNMPTRTKLIFVSKYFAEEVIEDTKVDIKGTQYEIIHNPIDTEKFIFKPKGIEQRKKILSIRPYASMKYANDLSVKAVLSLSKTKIFDKLEFLFVGAGKLFEETLMPLRNFPNVEIREGFLNHDQISKLHKSYGVFLTPTRMDSQGVSRDEAMSSGLVPITNAVTAIPEFVDDNSGILVDGEDFEGMANGIIMLYENPEVFSNLSRNASLRVNNQSSTNIIIDRELELIMRDGE